MRKYLNLNNMKYFLCFWEGDGGDRESCSVYYSKLVIANNEDEAFEKYFDTFRLPITKEDRESYSILEMKPIQ
jgi:hypothetical protein